ncbi:MAG: DUF4864 domain-containing protein [Oleiphilaceae bacterium]|nr:DUF4864 domain-containing protein [Oleiphilaceae bacterium]
MFSQFRPSSRLPSRLGWLLLLALLSGSPLIALADNEAATEEQARSMQKVIRAQIEAFGEDQAQEAFRYASSAIQDLFQTPENFMAIVEQDYPAVYRAGFVEFADPVPHRGFVVQPLTLRGPEGRYWKGHYRMVREEGQWRINGVQISPVSRGI